MLREEVTPSLFSSWPHEHIEPFLATGITEIMKIKTAVVVFAVLTAFVGTAAQAQIAGMNGVWRLNQDLSSPKAQCEILNYAVTADEQHYVVDEISPDGKKFNTEYRAKYDGKEYANRNLVSGEVNYVKLRKVLDRVEEVTNIGHVKGPDGKEASVVRGYYIRVLSPNGQQIISVLSSMLPDGTFQVTGVRYFDKVESGKPKC